MKITRVSTQALRLPVDYAPYRRDGAGTKYAWGRLGRITPYRPEPVLDYLIVRIDTDEAVTGIGEAPPDIGFFGETLEEAKSSVDRYLAPKLIGKNPFNRESILFDIDYRGNSCAKSGIDLALHDLMGRALGIPVSTLLGGTHREKVLVSLEIAGGPAEEMAALCARYVEEGVRAFKPKIGGIPEADAERLRAIREAVGPEVSLRADANQGYTPKEAIRLCRLVERQNVGIELLEQPVLAHDLEGMALVRRSVDTLIEADESAYTPADVMRIIRAEAADVINIKVAKTGGLANAKKIAALVEAAGLQCVLGTAYGLGVGIAAKLHCAASLNRFLDAVEFTEISLHDNLLLPPHDRLLGLPLEEGCFQVPDGPGFGIELDEEKVSEFEVEIGNL